MSNIYYSSTCIELNVGGTTWKRVAKYKADRFNLECKGSDTNSHDCVKK